MAAAPGRFARFAREGFEREAAALGLELVAEPADADAVLLCGPFEWELERLRTLPRTKLLGGVSPGLTAIAERLDPEGLLAPVQWHPDLGGPPGLEDYVAAQAYAAAADRRALPGSRRTRSASKPRRSSARSGSLPTGSRSGTSCPSSSGAAAAGCCCSPGHRVWYRSKAMPLADVEVLTPASADEAIAAFGDGGGVTVIGGGTIVMPDLASGRLRPGKALLLSQAGLDGVARDGGKVTIGAAAPLSALEDGDEPLATAVRHCADPEIRGQATVGGNVCSVASADAPRGDLQAPLIVLGASVRSVGAGGERTEPIEDFLADGDGRLVLEICYDDAKRKTGYAASTRPHTHHYTILAVSAAEHDGELRVAATGLGAARREDRSREPAGGRRPARRRGRLGLVPRTGAAHAGRTSIGRPLVEGER